MEKMTIISGLLTNANNIEQMGMCHAGAWDLCTFGSSARIVCGELFNGQDYLYVYNEEFHTQEGEIPASGIIRSGEDLIYMYLISK